MLIAVELNTLNAGSHFSGSNNYSGPYHVAQKATIMARKSIHVFL